MLTSKVESCPRGYPRLAAFLDSDENFMVYRRFGFIQSRLLLEKQDELRELEEKLDRLDKIEADAGDWIPETRDLPERYLEPRKKLMDVLEKRFCAYGKFGHSSIFLYVKANISSASLVDAAQKMVSLNQPSQSDLLSVRYYMEQQKPLVEEEASWKDKEEDMIILRGGREHAWLDASIEKLLKLFHCKLLEVRLFKIMVLDYR